MMKMRGYRVLVKPDPLMTKTKGGIVLNVNEKLERGGIQRGIVIDIGDKAYKNFREIDENGKERNGKSWCEVGDYVLYAKNAGRFVEDPFEPIKNDDDLYVIMNDEDIISVLTEGPNIIPGNEVKDKAKEISKF